MQEAVSTARLLPYSCAGTPWLMLSDFLLFPHDQHPIVDIQGVIYEYTSTQHFNSCYLLNDPDNWTSQALFGASCLVGLGGTPAASAAAHRVQSLDAQGCEGPAGPLSNCRTWVPAGRTFAPEILSQRLARKFPPSTCWDGWQSLHAASWAWWSFIFLAVAWSSRSLSNCAGGLRSLDPRALPCWIPCSIVVTM